jgi:GNAT superfamily N-acetyltransferase
MAGPATSRPELLDPIIRPATDDDVGPIDAMLDGHDEVSEAPPPRPGMRAARLRQLLQRGEAHVAVVDGRVVGFGGTVDIGRAIHLTDLFVDRDFLGRGIGGRLLPPLFRDRWPRTTFSSDDPRAMPLYIRSGMTPYWPNLYVTADERVLAPIPSGFDAEPATAAQLAAIEADWSGVDRQADYRMWNDRDGATSTVVRRSGSIVAIVQSRIRARGDGRWIDRAIIAPTEDPAEAAAAVIRFASEPGQEIGACIPGPHPALPGLIESGFRIVDHDTFMASEPDLVDPIRTFVDPSTP